MKISYVLGLFLNIQDSSAVGLKQQFVTDSLKELASRAPELGIIQNKLDRYQTLSPRIDAAISGVHEVLSPIPYVEQRVIHHPSPNVVVHDVYDAPACGGGCECYNTCGGMGMMGMGMQVAAPIQYIAPVTHVNHVHHNHHVHHTQHVHHVHHVHHKKEDLELKLMAGAAMDKLNQKDEVESIKSMAAAALTKVNMPQPGVKEMAVKALTKINAQEEKQTKDCEKTKSCSNAQVSEGNVETIENLQSKAIDLVDKEFRSAPQQPEQSKEDKVSEDLKEAEEIAEQEAERLAPSLAQKPYSQDQEGIETFRI